MQACEHVKMAPCLLQVGFDSYLVMRHGAPPGASNMPGAKQPAAIPHQHPEAGAASEAPASSTAAISAGENAAAAADCAARLGCYFCNDIVAPLNSTRDRALDQQVSALLHTAACSWQLLMLHTLHAVAVVGCKHWVTDLQPAFCKW